MKNYLNKTNVVIKLIIEALPRHTPKEDEKLPLFYYTILFKTIHSLEGCVSLISCFHIKPFFYITFLSGIRDIISDLICAEFISMKELDRSATIENELSNIYNDHYIHTGNILPINKLLFGNEQGYDEAEQRFKELKGTQKTTSNSTFSRIRYIYEKGNKDTRPDIKNLYYWFILFSKNAHFGELTEKLILQSTNSDSINFKKMIRAIVELVIKFCIGLLIKLGKTDCSELETQFSELSKIGFD